MTEMFADIEQVSLQIRTHISLQMNENFCNIRFTLFYQNITNTVIICIKITNVSKDNTDL